LLEQRYLLAAFSIQGDYDQNGTVDGGDYVGWRHTLAQSGAGLAADGNGDGIVNQPDYDAWRTNFGKVLGSDLGTLTKLSGTVPILRSPRSKMGLSPSRRQFC
jgi:hypothetical protein